MISSKIAPQPRMVDGWRALVYGHDGASVNEAMTPKRAEFTHWRAIAGHDEGSTVVQRTHDSTTVVAKLALGYLPSHLTIVALGATGPSRALGLATQTNSRSTRSAPHRRRRRRRSNEKTPMHRAQLSRQPMTRPPLRREVGVRVGSLASPVEPRLPIRIPGLEDQSPTRRQRRMHATKYRAPIRRRSVSGRP